MKKRVSRLVIAIAAAVVLLGSYSHVRVAYLAALVLVESATPDVDGPIAVLRPDPLVEQVSFEVGDKRIVADLYSPARGRRHPGIVLNHGVAPDGRRDARLVNFADALARAGFVSLVPEFTNLAGFRVRPSDVDEIVGAFEYLESSPLVRSDRIGLFGFSYAGGLSVLAAGDERISERVRFCFSLGGYYDLRNVVTFMTTGMYRDGDRWSYLEPQSSGKWAFLLNSIDLIEDERDRSLLQGIARLKLDEPGSDVSGRVEALGEEGARVYALMVNRDPKLVGSMIDGLNERVRGYFERLSPKGRMGAVRTHLILGHGRDDNMIPYTESLALARAAPPAATVHLKILDSFKHVDLRLGEGGGIRDLMASAREIGRLFSITHDLVSWGLS